MKSTKSITRQAMIAAIYTITSTLLSYISFGTVQVRISEALTILPVFGTEYIMGVTVGCFFTNLIGVATGANILGSLDVVFGTAATLLAGFATYRLRNVKYKGLPILAATPPIIFNAVTVGMELCVMMTGGFNALVFGRQALSVGIGETFSCIIGLVLVKVIQSNSNLESLFA
jgi:uncharacterized membrane protein